MQRHLQNCGTKFDPRAMQSIQRPPMCFSSFEIPNSYQDPKRNTQKGILKKEYPKRNTHMKEKHLMHI